MEPDRVPMNRDSERTRGVVRRLKAISNAFIDNLGALLLAFGFALALVGTSVRVSREYRMTKVEEANMVPTFAPIHLVAMPATVVPLATPIPPPHRLRIPAIDLDTSVVELGWEAKVVNGETYSEWQTAAFAAGYHTNSAPPGEIGNTVISGHNNIEGAVFKDIHLLDFDDRIFLHVGNELFEYTVDANFVVREAGADPEDRKKNAQWIGPTSDRRLTMVTCFPPWSNTHRTIIIARPVPEEIMSDGPAVSMQ